jgi:hypothetical protein
MICDDCGKEAHLQCEHCGRKTCLEHYDMERHPVKVTAFDMETGQKHTGFYTADDLFEFWKRRGPLYDAVKGDAK